MYKFQNKALAKLFTKMNPKQQEQNNTKNDVYMVLEETDPSHQQNLQLPVLAELATTNNSSNKQI
ncbi:4382_t:CDS:2 [Cetraspora pellucida]|uniref:4382_t:CDS:1 n=1 Tax=Cetraspora pellucida TaxID=1433469 RepID=A0A9N9APX5_9GLOM|nr:4382_t:CDS:2 [Cetraspora pellucida]